MTTILDVVEKGTKFLHGKEIADPRLTMELMVAHELGLKRMDLYLRFDQPLDDQNLASLREKLRQKGQGIPLQHINGTVSFHHYEFRCDHRGLVPRPETEELVSIVEKTGFPRPTRILDLGCGSGVLGLTLAKILGENCHGLVMADLSPDALSLAQENAELLEIPAAKTIQTNLFDQLPSDHPFDLILANLPYVAESERPKISPEVKHDPEMALFAGPDGLDLIRPFVATCADFLNPGGLVAMEVGYDQGEIVARLLNNAGLTDVSLHHDLNGIARFPLARKA